MSLMQTNCPKCPLCNRSCFKLVSYTDDGKGLRMCSACKKRKKNGIKIIRFKG